MEEQSRSARKREVEGLQRLGVRLTELAPEELERLELPDDLREAVVQLRAITTRGARRRQMQYIGVLMRGFDATRVQETFAAIDSGRNRDAAALHRLERWRDRLIGGEEELIEKIVAEHPGVDRQRLRQLVRNARAEAEAEAHAEAADPEGLPQAQSAPAARVLFRYLRDAAGLRG